MSGARSREPMGLELAEFSLLEAIRIHADPISIHVRVVGGRGARRHARRIDGRWIPARPHTLPRRATAYADLIHLLGLDLPPPRGKPFVAMVHDLSPLHYDDEGTLPPWLDEISERASFLLTPSEFTASELRQHLGVAGERIRVVGGAPALEARDATPLLPAELRALGIEPPFVLRYGGYTTRKNVPLLLDAWARVSSGTLVLAGPPQPARREILAAARSLDRIVVLDYVPSTVLAGLLRSATLLASTSTYEGYGLPPLEAMAAGTPVVAVSTAFTREMCGDAAYLVEPDAEALTQAISRVLQDAGLARGLREAGLARAGNFSWDRVAHGVLSAYAEVPRG